MNRKLITLGLITMSFLVSACGSGAPHRVADEEFDSTFSGKSFSNLLVMGVYEDRTFRISSEVALAEELKVRGVDASPSYDLLPNAKVSAQGIQRAISSGSFDGVLIVATIDAGYEYDAGDYFETRGMVYLLGGEPGAGTDIASLIAWSGAGQYSLYVGLWDAESGKPVWSATTDSEDIGSPTDDLRALAGMVVDEMKKKGLL